MRKWLRSQISAFRFAWYFHKYNKVKGTPEQFRYEFKIRLLVKEVAKELGVTERSLWAAMKEEGYEL